MPIYLVIPDEYPYILMGVVVNYFFCQMTPFFTALKVRGGVFTEQHLDGFKEAHKEAYPDREVDPLGLPDQGTGWYSAQLNYKDWISLQSAYRIPQNYLEQLPVITILSMVSGFYFPLIAAIAIWVYALGRIIYSAGYLKGPQFRIPGGICMMICNMTLIITSVISAVKFLGNSTA